MPWSLMRRDGEVVVVRERDKKVVGRHKSRARALRHLRALYSLEKASFGGDRSAAGRYAAEQRWKGHRKADTKSEPRVSANLRTQLSLIGHAMKSVEDAGVSYARYPDLLSKEQKKELMKEIKQLWFQADRLGKKLDDPNNDYSEKDRQRLVLALSRAYEACRLAELAIEQMLKAPYDKRFTQELVVARDRHGQLTGMMVVMRKDEEYEDSLIMDGHDTREKVTGRSMEISYLASFQTEKGMGRALFGKALKDSVGKNVVQILLEWTDQSQPFWSRFGFDYDRRYGSASVNLNVRLDEIATLLP